VRTTRLLPALALLVVPLAGCASGLHDATSHERATPYVANADVGSVDVRDVVIAPAAGGSTSAQAFISMVLLSSKPDELTGVALDGGGTVTPTDASASLAISPNNVLTIANPETPTTDPGLAITGLPQPPVVGTTIKVTLTFRDAGSVQLDVPVEDAPGI
jgi:copper(I)-binding protein